ncbi:MULTISPECIES: FAD-binding oxidoreductase [Bradyrhizobium]|uniref:D-lactate dehydrogenase (cytochrome) n=1 Tax=Bradyrhizobium brasilense TaxID=1419277 RepID=A0ABY8JKJ9_9BRAD|nr:MULTISPECIES: FAD-linked oxidase C-terminal domain-containing protein [Bradyrhizobium]MCP1848870.1 D-lactate dehydrogenase (cytochrome) [Bradyrhizobium sp. USDA 4541]WFU65344.1 FAD-linked oxidase C-terminal domain-containing protein [Bradyrhizobium brasilense]
MTRATREAIAQLSERFGDKLSTVASVRRHHASGVTSHMTIAPDAVLFAASTQDVVDAVTICHHYRCPVVPFGTGTSTEGQISAEQGGLTIDLSGMDRILRVSPSDLDCTVEAGVTRKALNAALRDTGLFFPIDPGADASIGGMASTRASGTNAVRYGTMREFVTSLRVVLADGQLIDTGTRARKSSAGYDLTRLFVGAEGTLGVVTEVTLRLAPIPERIGAAVCTFPTVEAAVSAVVTAIQSAIPLARAELLDALQVEACNHYSKLDLAVQPTLFLEFHGTHQAVDEQVSLMSAITAEFGGSAFRWATAPEDRTKLWQARHDVWWAALALRPGSQGIPTDVCVPISELPGVIAQTRQDVVELNLIAPLCGHVGDGNFHLCVLVDPEDEGEKRRIAELNARMIARAHAVGGTCTGEHGIGTGKMDYLVAERGAGMMTLAALKRALDPRNVMNPGKILRVDDYQPYA